MSMTFFITTVLYLSRIFLCSLLHVKTYPICYSPCIFVYMVESYATLYTLAGILSGSYVGIYFINWLISSSDSRGTLARHAEGSLCK